MEKTVEGYLQRQKSPQKEICAKIRALILKTFPKINEEMKMGVPWYERKFYIVALKDHVNIGFSVNGLTSEEMALFEGSGKLMRHLKFFSPADVDGKKISDLLKLVDKKYVKTSCSS